MFTFLGLFCLCSREDVEEEELADPSTVAEEKEYVSTCRGTGSSEAHLQVDPWEARPAVD